MLYGIASNALMAIIFCRRRNNLNSRSFILITYQLIISAFFNFIPQVAIVLLQMLMTKKSSDAFKKTWIYGIFAATDTFSFLSMLHFAFLLTVNRFVAMNFPKLNFFFESIKFHFVIAFVWLSAFVIPLVQFYLCTKTFNVSNLHWSSSCTKKTPESGRTFQKFLYVWALTLPIMMFLIYILIFYNMRRKRKTTSDQQRANGMYIGYQVKARSGAGKYERSMLIQAAVLCAAIEVHIICYYFSVPLAIKIVGEKAEIPVNIFNNCYTIFNNAVLPTVNLIFVKRFRDEVKRTIIELLSKIMNRQVMTTVIPATSVALTKVQPTFHAR